MSDVFPFGSLQGEYIKTMIKLERVIFQRFQNSVGLFNR
jgi:hypothetical protein